MVRWCFVYEVCGYLLRCLQVFGNDLCRRRCVHATLTLLWGWEVDCVM